MPVVAHSGLPSFDYLRQRGEEVLSLERALAQDIRELHIGLLNMMPDAALRVTEQQFIRLIGASNQIAQFYVHVFTVPGLPRSEKSQAYIDQYYEDFEDIREQGLDALIITGANIVNPTLEQEPFWEPLKEVIRWASEHVTSVLCSCLATHALVKYLHGIERQPLPRKQWGVYSHRITRWHPLLRGINTRFDVPHSRNNGITPVQFRDAGLVVLAESDDVGVHMAVSEDLFRIVYFQGHPEYFINSLLKEYKREVLRYFTGERPDFPPYPENYFNTWAKQIMQDWWQTALPAHQRGLPLPEFPEELILPHLDNTWADTAKAILNNWMGLVYQLTHVERQKAFADAVDANDPLGLRYRTVEFKRIWEDL
jgi:homoserine O-succinyltransferase